MNPTLLKGRSLLTWINYSPSEIEVFLESCRKAKSDCRKRSKKQQFRGKTMVVLGKCDFIFYQLAFEKEFVDEGGTILSLQNDAEINNAGVSWEDTARGLGYTCDVLLAQGLSHASMEMLAKFAAGYPVCNLQSDEFVPVQALNLYFTMEEILREAKGKRLVFVGDGKAALANSLMILCAKMGSDYTLVSPRDRWPDPALKQIADSIAKESGAALAITAEPIAGVHGADALVSSPWNPSLMAGEYSVDEQLLKETGNSECIFFHNIPCARRLGISNGVAESAQSRIFQLAQNQRYVARAILQTIL